MQRDLSQRIDECREQWRLRHLGPRFASGAVSAALPVELEDGTPAVLKLGDAHRESEHEPDALLAWDGKGAVRLLAVDRERHALLLERCSPGTPLSRLPADKALDVLVALLDRLLVRAGPPFRRLVDEAAWWTESLPRQWEEAGRPFERRLLDAALAALSELAPTQGSPVLLHQDLHADNVLHAEREPWLAIDPKPLAGEREFAVAPIVRGAELGARERDVRHRLARLVSELELDGERVRGWAGAQTLAWAFDGHRALPYNVECARWLLQA